MDKREKCGWCRDGDILEAYHDAEWGEPVHDDRKHFEFLLMESLQCGLNWLMMLKKRAVFAKCFADFDIARVAAFGEDDVSRVLAEPGMIRSAPKIRAVIGNARCFLRIAEEFGSFDRYLWGFTEGKMRVYPAHRLEGAPARNELSDAISKDLKRRGFKYMGSITVYSHLQACGMINDHDPACFRCEEIMRAQPVQWME